MFSIAIGNLMSATSRAESAYQIGEFYEAKRNYEFAFYYFIVSALNYHGDAFLKLAMIYFFGYHHIVPDLGKVIPMLLCATAQGNKIATYLLCNKVGYMGWVSLLSTEHARLVVSQTRSNPTSTAQTMSSLNTSSNNNSSQSVMEIKIDQPMSVVTMTNSNSSNNNSGNNHTAGSSYDSNSNNMWSNPESSTKRDASSSPTFSLSDLFEPSHFR